MLRLEAPCTALWCVYVMLLNSGCASPYYHIEQGALPDGGVGDVRVSPGEVLTEESIVLCRWYRDREVCATPEYWQREAKRSRRRYEIYKSSSINSTESAPSLSADGAILRC